MDANKQGESEVAPIIWTICTPIVFIIGLVGNSLTILVLNRKAKRSSTTVYLTGLAISDLLLVVFGMPRWWLIYNFGYDIRHYSVATCKIHWWLLYGTGLMSSLFLVSLTLERILSLARPYRVRILCSVKHSVFISVSIALVSYFVHAHVLYGFNLDYEPKSPLNQPNHCNSSDESEDKMIQSNTTCEDKKQSENNSIKVPVCSWTYDESYRKFYENYQDPFHFTTYFFFPQVVSLLGGTYIVWKVIQNSRFRKSLHQKSTSYDSRTNQITFMLPLINLLFLVLVCPVLVFLIGRNYWVDKKMTPVQEVVWAIVSMLHFLNHSINFILYFLSGSRFRETFFNFLRCNLSRRTPYGLSTSDRMPAVVEMELRRTSSNMESYGFQCPPI